MKVFEMLKNWYDIWRQHSPGVSLLKDLITPLVYGWSYERRMLAFLPQRTSRTSWTCRLATRSPRPRNWVKARCCRVSFGMRGLVHSSARTRGNADLVRLGRRLICWLRLLCFQSTGLTEILGDTVGVIFGSDHVIIL